MIEITKPGKIKKYELKCKNCECEFLAELTDGFTSECTTILHRSTWSDLFIRHKITEVFIVDCPSCKQRVEKEIGVRYTEWK